MTEEDKIGVEFEVHRSSHRERGNAERPCPSATWDADGNRWVVRIETIDDLLALGVATDAPILVLAVGGTDDDRNVLEVLDTEDPDVVVDGLRTRAAGRSMS